MSQSEHPNRQKNIKAAPQREGGFLKALLSDASANTLAIGAAAMVPLVAMVGGGIDASRYYMAQSRLQAACDAGALAGRRAMETTNYTASQTDNPNDPSPQDISNRFFDENYPDGTFGMASLQRSYSADSEGLVTGTASGDMPTTLMGMFGYNDVGLTVTCSADINIANTDIMFVLDVTGSMQCTSEMDNDTCLPNVQWSNVQDASGNDVLPASDSRLADLQSAAKDFYDTIAGSTSSQAQVRYGFVPYSSTVNVGHILYAENPNWLATQANYQSREPNFNEFWQTVDDDTSFGNFTPEEDQNDFQMRRRGDVSEEFCIYYFNDVWRSSEKFLHDQWEDIPGTQDESGATSDVQTIGNTRITTTTGITARQERGYPAYDYDPDSEDPVFKCQVGYQWFERTGEFTRVLEEELTRTFVDYTYKDRSFTLPASLYTSGSATLKTGRDIDTAGDVVHTWDGCIHEADTVAQSDFTTVPANAYDLDINLLPSNNAERWRPALPSLTYFRYANGLDNRNVPWWYNSYRRSATEPTDWRTGNINSTEEKENLAEFVGSNGAAYACPAEAQRLQRMTESQFDTYVDSLRAWGATYHDAGMIWGARFLSPNGVFSTENTTSTNGSAISRHIIFMTDGQQATSQSVNSLYGIEFWDRHVTTDGSQDAMATNHAARFQAACRAARNENISVWVIAFGTDLTQNLTDCATPGRDFYAGDKQELTTTFRNIAQQIAELRLTQ